MGGINVWAFIALTASALLFVVDATRAGSLSRVAGALLAIGVCAAFFFNGQEPLLHP